MTGVLYAVDAEAEAEVEVVGPYGELFEGEEEERGKVRAW